MYIFLKAVDIIVNNTLYSLCFCVEYLSSCSSALTCPPRAPSDLLIKQSLTAAQAFTVVWGALHWACRVSSCGTGLLLQHSLLSSCSLWA